MPILPTPSQVDAVIQNSTTGVVDYLEYAGVNLVSSLAVDYGLGSTFKIVGSGDYNMDGHPDLVAQSTTTGQLDFLFLDAHAQLIGSAMTTASFPTVRAGEGYFTGAAVGPLLISQLPDGELDLLGFNRGSLIASDLIPNTAGLAPVVGVANGNPGSTPVPAFNGVGTGANDNIFTQLPEGTIDVLGFSGSFSAGLTLTSSDLLSASIGSPRVFAADQDFSLGGGLVNANIPLTIPSSGTVTQGVQFLAQTPTGQLDALYFDSGYNSLPDMNNFYASTLLTPSFPGWQGVDGGIVANVSVFPFT